MAQKLLTQRQLRVARLIAQGLSDQEIATRLEITSATVKAHGYSIRKRLNLHGYTRVRTTLWYLSQCSAAERKAILGGWSAA